MQEELKTTENPIPKEIFDKILSIELSDVFENLPKESKNNIFSEWKKQGESLINIELFSELIEDEKFRIEQKNKEPKIYIDMDGVLCKFIPCDDMETLYQEGYFLNLEPNKKFINNVKNLIDEGGNVYILSSFLSDSEFAYDEKNMWLDKHLSQIDNSHRILVPYGENKSNFIREIKAEDILLDDYSKNLKEWQLAGGRGIKVINDINGQGIKWSGERVSISDDFLKLKNTVLKPKFKQNYIKRGRGI